MKLFLNLIIIWKKRIYNSSCFEEYEAGLETRIHAIRAKLSEAQI